MIPLIEQHRPELISLCQRYRVRQLDLFGSAAKGKFQPTSSDLDFIVQFDAPGEPGYASRYYDFATSLESLFQRPVDLLTERMIRNAYFREEIEKTRQNIYEQ